MKIHHASIMVVVALLAAAIVSETVPGLKTAMLWMAVGSVLFGLLFALSSLFDKEKRKPALVMLFTMAVIMTGLMTQLLPIISETLSTPPIPTPTPLPFQIT